jgi:hypothetical protein
MIVAMSNQQLPDGFKCPYRSQCWQREIARLLAAVMIAAVAGALAGCAIRFRGPGLDLDVKPVYPTSRAAAVPIAAE